MPTDLTIPAIRPTLPQLDEVARILRRRDAEPTPSERVRADPRVKCTWEDWDLFREAMLNSCAE